MPFAPHSRARIASNLVQQDLSNPSRGISHEQYNAGPPADTLDFVQELIDANKDLWEQLVNNEFCAKMAAGTASLDGFRYYMIQDTLYLQNYVRYKLGLFQKAQNWDDLSQAATSIKNDVDFANDQLTVCVEKLGVPKDIVLGTAMNHDMMDYTMFEDQEALTDDWFSLHVVLLPCLVGYYKIAKKLDEDTATLKNTVFYDIWISGNLDDSSAKKSRDFCNTNAAQWQSPIQKQKWTSLFRHACEMEIKAFHIGVQAPSPYMTIPDETYYCIVNSSGQVAVDLENSDFTAKTQDKSESQQWYLELTANGYSVKNKKSGIYMGAKSIQGEYELASTSDHEGTWWINPSGSGYSLLLVRNLSFVVELSGTKVQVGKSTKAAAEVWAFQKP